MSNNRTIDFAYMIAAILARSLLALNPSQIIRDAGAQTYEEQYDYQDSSNYYQQDDNYQYGYEDDDRNYYKNDYND